MPINQAPHIHQLVICANVFVRKDGKYLMLARSPQKKYAPDVVHPIGGKLDPNENPYQCALRELFEEAGIQVKNVRLEAVLLEILPIPDEPNNWLIFHFSADWQSGKLKTTEEGEFVWLTASQIVKQKLFPSLRPVIKQILNPRAGAVFATMAYKNKNEIDKKSLVIDKCT